MPKRVDPVARRNAVVDALFRVAVRDGLQRASLRVVADEAEINIGSLRHYFASHQELMTFAMRSMLDRLGERVRARLDEVGDRPGRTALVELFAELLPLDGRRRGEATVFVEFVTAARTDPAFAELSHGAATGARDLVRQVLSRLDLPAGRDVRVETERLAALLDGLTLSAVLYPDICGEAECTAALEAHLRDLTT